MEIKKMCGYGKSPSQILVDRAKQDDPEKIYHKSRVDYLDQDLMKRIDFIINHRLTDVQRKIIIAEYCERFRFLRQAAHWVGISRNWYRKQRDKAHDNIEEWLV